MNDFEVLVFLGLSALIAFWTGWIANGSRVSKAYEDDIDEWERLWKKVVDDDKDIIKRLTDQRDDYAISDGYKREALKFYADAGNWMNGEVSKDGGDIARIAIGDLRVIKREAV